MFGLPGNFDPSFLRGRTLLQVCVGLHQAILRFDGEVEISIECDFSVSIDGYETTYPSTISGASALMILLSQKIVETSSTADGTLSATFERGTVTIFDSADHYESYQIRNGADLYVI